MAYYSLMVHFTPLLQAGGRGSVVNLASRAAYACLPALNVTELTGEHQSYDPDLRYRTTKAAELMLTWEAARLFKGSGVVYNAVHPGITNFAISRINKEATKDWSEAKIEERASKPYDEPSELATKIVSLAVDAPSEGVSGTWWVKDVGRPSVQKPRIFDQPQPSAALWEYCSSVDRAWCTAYNSDHPGLELECAV